MLSSRARTAVSLLPELGSTAGQLAAAAIVARRPPRVHPAAGEPRVVAYLRGEHTLSFMGKKVGGAATHTSGVINGLTRCGLDVRVFAAEIPDGIESARVTVVVPRRVFQLVSWLTQFAYSRQLVRAAQSTGADLVYQRNALGSYAGLELARRLKAPFVLEYNHSEIWLQRNWSSEPLPLENLAAELEHRNLLDAALIVVSSDVLRGQLLDVGIDPEKILVNANGVDVEGLAAARAEPAQVWRERLGRTQSPTVGFVGTFGQWHGVTELPAMIEATAAARPDVRWVLIGDGALHDGVAAEIDRRGFSEAVDMTGLVEHERAVELLASCDVCVSPHVPNDDGTRFFGSPTKLFEYMGLGKPIVASDLDQIGEVLEHERNALLCEPRDPAAAAAAVVRLLGAPALADRLGSQALQDARERHSWNAHVARILEALRARTEVTSKP